MPTPSAIITLLLATLFAPANDAPKDYPFTPVPFTRVTIQDQFWAPRIETNRVVTIPYSFTKCEETGRIQNFEVAAGLKEGKHQGIRFDDSDVFKIMEGASYSLAIHPDPELEAYMDRLIGLVAAAQEPDGYLYTARTINPARTAPASGDERWSFLDQSHELYNVGHMYEAAVAHFQATGKRSFLDVAIKNADLIVRTFGPGRQYGVPGHQEIEIGLVKLYRVTGNENYLNIARYFLDMRGREVPDARFPQKLDPYFQSHKPVIEQEEAVGHSVRATYMYSGMADVAAITGDANYIRAIDRIWGNVVSKKIYLTGGIGSRHEGEAFGADYELPNESAYNETCAAIGNIFWNQRMFLLKGNARYIDVLERTLYNGFLSGISFQGNTFFYPNPLACDGHYAFNQGSLERKPWFDCSCCPSNIARFLPSLSGYIYAVKSDSLYVNLYIGNEGSVDLPSGKVNVRMETHYPWQESVRLSITPLRNGSFTLMLRIPGWIGQHPLPGNLYRYADTKSYAETIQVNGETVLTPRHQGYAVVTRKWKKGDVVTLTLPMPLRRVHSDPRVADNKGRVALERGPVVFCAEGIDNQGAVYNLIIPADAALECRFEQGLFDGVYTIQAQVPFFQVTGDRKGVTTQSHPFKAVPYYAWAHRGAGQMAVWLPEHIGSLRVYP
jgi:uncharacterized protein